MATESAEDFHSYPAALHAKVAAAKAGWEIAVCARHAVTPEYYWRHDTDGAALHAAKALTALAARYLERAVVAARAEGLSWTAIGEALGHPDPEKVFTSAIDGWNAELTAVRDGFPPLESGLELDWVVDTPWWTEALRKWLVEPGRNILDRASDPVPPADTGRWCPGEGKGRRVPDDGDFLP